MGTMVANQDDPLDFNVRKGTFVVVRMDMRESMANRGGGHVRPSVGLITKRCFQLVLNSPQIRVVRSWTHERGDDPMFVFWMRMQVGGYMNVENVIVRFTPRLVEQQAWLFKRRAARLKDHRRE